MRIRQWLRDAWDNVFMPTEEKRGDDDSVKDLLRLKIKPGRSKFVYFMLLLCFHRARRPHRLASAWF